ncbi:MAG: DUF1800 domain-containing protein [Saprospiraceae bacterium]
MGYFLPFLSLAPYTGTWTNRHAAHLLRRTTFGANFDQIKDFTAQGVDQCVDQLTRDINMPTPPINVSYAEDPNVPIGETWVDKGTSQNVNGYRRTSLYNWSFELMLQNNPHIREKMTLFWHNHFVTANITDPRAVYYYIDKLRTFSLGNFKEMAKVITIDYAMLDFLNGRENTRQAPNENYARELLELFTLGKGVSEGNGDYTTYTEGDIKEIARVLTGWVEVRNAIPIRTQFNLSRHDTGTKTLSHRFNNAIIQNAGADEYKNLIDLIFTREEVAEFICKKLYTWFVNHDITDDVVLNVIKPMADIFRQNNYEVKPVIKVLLNSEHFYEECQFGRIVKNPIDYVINPLNQFSMSLPDDLVLKSRALSGLYNITNAQQMALYQAPSVAGWQAYYQAPLYYKLWLNSFSLPSRKSYTDAIANNGISYGAFRLQIDPVSLAEKCANPTDPEALISELSLLFSCLPYATNQMTVLIGVLLGTETQAQWATKWNNYITSPTTNNKQLVTTKLRPVITYMTRMPEFHLS